MSTSTQPVTAQQAQMLEQAKAYHGLTVPGMPPDWIFNAQGRLENRTTGSLVQIADPSTIPGSGFWGQLLHASPYIAGAFGMGALGGVGAGGGAVTPALTGVEAGAHAGLNAGVFGTAGTTAAATGTGLLHSPLLVPTLVGTVGSVFSNIYGAKKATDAANHAADLQAQAQAEALAFTKAQAENAFANSEASRRGNYDQWAAAQRRLGSVGDLIGAGPREIPAYVPGVDPNFSGTPGAASPMPGAGNVGQASQMFLSAMQESGLDPVAVQGHGQVIADAVNKKYPGLGVSVDPTTDAIVWPGIGPLDVTIDSGKGGFYFRPSSAAPASSAPVGSAASYLTPQMPTPYAPVPIAPGLAFGSVGSYFRR